MVAIDTPEQVRFPRTRGDRPPADLCMACYREVPPHARG